MNKRILALLGAFVAGIACLFVMVYGFSERFFVTGSFDSVTSVTVSWGSDGLNTVTVTDPQEIDRFFEALTHTSKLRFNPYPQHEQGLHADPVYSLAITYHNGDMESITTQEGGKRIYRRLNTKGDHGDSGYISAYNEELFEWAKAIVTK